MVKHHISGMSPLSKSSIKSLQAGTPGVPVPLEPYVYRDSEDD